MEKHLVTIEFRYSDAPIHKGGSTHRTKTVTIGFYDDFDEACKNGNHLMEVLESKFELHQFPDGTKAPKERFSKNGGAFGSKLTLISDLAYLRTPFSFFAKITTLRYTPIEEAINEVVSATKRSIEYKASISDE